MAIRRAALQDMRPILDYMADYHKESNLADIPFDRTSAAQIVEYYILSKDSVGLLAINKEKQVKGLMFGSLEPFFFNRKYTYATDLMFMSKGFGPQLFKKFTEWALASGARRIIMGVSSGDDRACQLLEALGMECVGGMYVLRS